MSETNDLEWGLCDHDLAPGAFRDDDDEAYDEEWDGLRAFYDEGDDEPLEELMARVAVEIKAGREVILPGWELSWPSPEVVVWTTPSGRRRGSILTSRLLHHMRPSYMTADGRGRCPAGRQEEVCPPPFSRLS